MPQLPDFSKEIANSEKFLAANPEKKEDVLLLLFALLYQNQNSNSFEAYNFLFALLEKIFPRLEAYTFAKFHFALVTAPQHQEKFLSRFQSLFSASEKQKLLTELEQSPFSIPRKIKNFCNACTKIRNTHPMKKNPCPACFPCRKNSCTPFQSS